MKNFQIKNAFNELVGVASKNKSNLRVNLKEVDKIAAENGIVQSGKKSIEELPATAIRATYFNELVNAAAKDKRKLCVNLKEVDKIAAENGIV